MNLFKTLKFVLSHPLNASRRTSALIRFAQWQLGSRLLPGAVAVDYVNDLMLVVEPGMTGATGNIYCGLHEYQDMALILHALRSGDLFIDIGANVGSYSILAAATGAHAKAFEPIPSTFDALMRNIRFNGLEEQIQARNIALGSELGKLEFTSTLDTVNHVAAGEDSNSEKISVPVETLDACLAGSSAQVIKIDVEGFESAVLNGATEALDNAALLALIVELNGSGVRYGFDDDLIHEKLCGHGFKTYCYKPDSRQLIDLDGKRGSGGNTLYVRNPEALNERLTSAPLYTLGNGATI